MLSLQPQARKAERAAQELAYANAEVALVERWTAFLHDKTRKALIKGFPDFDDEKEPYQRRYEGRCEDSSKQDLSFPPDYLAATYPHNWKFTTPVPGDICEITTREHYEDGVLPFQALILSLHCEQQPGRTNQWTISFVQLNPGNRVVLPMWERVPMENVFCEVQIPHARPKSKIVAWLKPPTCSYEDHDGNNVTQQYKPVVEPYTRIYDRFRLFIRFVNFTQLVHRPKRQRDVDPEDDANVRLGDLAANRRGAGANTSRSAASGRGTGPPAAGRGGSGGGSAGGIGDVARARSASRPSRRQVRVVGRLGGDSTGGPGGGSGRGRPSPGGGNRERVAASLRHLGASERSEPRVDIVGELRELAELHDAGQIDDDEFTAAKKFLLAMS